MKLNNEVKLIISGYFNKGIDDLTTRMNSCSSVIKSGSLDADGTEYMRQVRNNYQTAAHELARLSKQMWDSND